MRFILNRTDSQNKADRQLERLGCKRLNIRHVALLTTPVTPTVGNVKEKNICTEKIYKIEGSAIKTSYRISSVLSSALLK